MRSSTNTNPVANGNRAAYAWAEADPRAVVLVAASDDGQAALGRAADAFTDAGLNDKARRVARVASMARTAGRMGALAAEIAPTLATLAPTFAPTLTAGLIELSAEIKLGGAQLNAELAVGVNEGVNAKLAEELNEKLALEVIHALHTTEAGGGWTALAVVWRGLAAVARPIETRHVISVTTDGDGRPLHRVPAQVDLATLSPVEAVTVDGVPLVSAGPEPLSTWRRVRPGKQRAFAFAGPRSLGGQAVGDVVIRKLASLPRMDMRSPIVGDVARVAALAFGLTGYGPIPDTAGAVFVGGQNTPANRERWWKACEWLRHMTITINERTGEWVGLANVDPDGAGGVHLGPPAWWRGKGNKQRWRLSGALWRPVQIGGKKRRGAGGQDVFHSGLARTLAGLEARLCYAPTAGRGKAGRVPDTLRPERPGGAGLRVFVAWQDLLTLAGEAVPIDATARSARAEHARFLRRVDALIAAGYHVPARGGVAPIGDTVEIVRVVDGRGHGQVAGVWIRASARFCEAASGRREWERIPATRLLRAAGDD